MHLIFNIILTKATNAQYCSFKTYAYTEHTILFIALSYPYAFFNAYNNKQKSKGIWYVQTSTNKSIKNKKAPKP